MSKTSSSGQQHRSVLCGEDKETMSKKVKEMLIKQYGYAPDLIFEVKPNRRIFAYKSCPFNPRVYTEKGLYFGKIESDGIRLTIEGTFLVGPKAGKGIIEIDREKAALWLAGKDLKLDIPVSGWVILKWGQYYLGCGKAKEGTIKNYVPKERRITLK